MSVIVEYAVRPTKLALAETVKRVDIRLVVERTVGTDPATPAVFIWVEGPDLNRFETIAEADPTVTDLLPLSRNDGRWLYRLQVTDETPIVTYPMVVKLGGRRLEAQYESGWWHSRARFPDPTAFEVYLDYLTDCGVEHQVVHQYEADGSRSEPDGLTDAQRETLTLAYQRGYFSVPREVTAAELATELEISNQAVSERLRRGYARLVERGIGP